MKLFIINGPNMNMLGIREQNMYGRQDYAQLVRFVEDVCRREGFECEFFQTNHEGVLVDIIQSAYGTADGIVINAAAYTHTSVAILDALKAVAVPAVEVHMTDVQSREEFRHVSYVGLACIACCAGHGFESYAEAVRKLKAYLCGGTV